MKSNLCPSTKTEVTKIASQWPAELERIATDVSDARNSASTAAQRAGVATSTAAKRPERMGLSRRDTAEVLGISHQRVQQLLAG